LLPHFPIPTQRGCLSHQKDETVSLNAGNDFTTDAKGFAGRGKYTLKRYLVRRSLFRWQHQHFGWFSRGGPLVLFPEFVFLFSSAPELLLEGGTPTRLLGVSGPSLAIQKRGVRCAKLLLS
jgi:hypothetical protein